MKKQEILKCYFNAKTASGITLIGLVVTIIILLIFSGISVNLLSGEKEILKKVTNAVDFNIEATAKQEMDMKIAQILIDYYNDIYVDKIYSVNTTKKDYIQTKIIAGTTTSGYEFTIEDGIVTIVHTDNNGLTRDLVGTLLETGDVFWDDELPIFTVTYDSNGGAGNVPEVQEIALGKTVTIDFTIFPTREGYEFLGWATDANSTIADYTNDGTKTFSMGEQNVILYAVWEKPAMALTAITAENYGDLVTYSANGITDWKIFYNDGENVFIIPSDYVPVSSLANTGMLTNGTYGAYWSTAPSEIQSGWNTYIDKYMMTYYRSSWISNKYENFRTVSSLLNAENWTDFSNDEYGLGEWAIGGPTLEMYVASWNGKSELEPTQYTKLYCNKTDGEGYFVGTTNKPTTTYKNMSGDAGYYDTLYYPHQEKYSDCNGYWLAAPSAERKNLMMYVGYQGSVSTYYYYQILCGVRPLVCLKSGVKGAVSETDGIRTWELSL